MIASNLIPCPSFEIAECSIPSDPEGKKLCVVRVRETYEICLLAKKGEKHPVRVRIEDQSPPADASQLRSLLSREDHGQNLAGSAANRFNQLATQLFVSKYKNHSRGSRSETFLQIMFCPNAHVPMRLDLVTERAFGKAIAEENPELQELVNLGQAKVEFRRGRDWCDPVSRATARP